MKLGLKTALVGFEKTPWLPQKVTPSKPVTLPGHTVSKQFHLKDNPGKQVSMDKLGEGERSEVIIIGLSFSSYYRPTV